LEVHLLDFSEVIYGRTLEVTFLKKLRDEKKFESFDALKNAIYNDIEQAKVLFSV
ncbi:MAG: riboflavin kinase, partial [Sinobacterium sp.]|nr:riboflavin kinase [Sinobacterium sp.]